MKTSEPSFLAKFIKSGWLVTLIIFVLTLVAVWESMQLNLFNGGLFWLAIITFGFYLLFFLLPFGGLIVPLTNEPLLRRVTSGVMIVVIGVHGWLLYSYTDSKVYLDEGGVQTALVNQTMRWSAIGACCLLILIYMVYLFKRRRL